MPNWQRVSTVSQLAAHLRGELALGRWRGRMPGVIRLSGELGVARNTVEAALRELEREGLLLPQGYGRGRLINLKETAAKLPGLRVALLLGDATDQGLDYIVTLEHKLEDAGHALLRTPKCLAQLRMDLKQVARMAMLTEADAWVVVGGSRELLEWFSRWDKPAFALFGRRRGLPIAAAGPDKAPVIAGIARTLAGLGHRRIVLLARQMRRKPTPGAPEQAFLDALAELGIPPGPYHLPEWEESVEGFHDRLEKLFRITPPTALIVDEVPLFAATQQFLAGKGLKVPEDVSLVCTDYDKSFGWCRPGISHIHWDSVPLVRRIMRWASNVSRGKRDVRQTLTPAEFVPGGTIGPARER